MEELKGRGALEAEIREDARRKAERALKQSDKDAESIRSEFEARSGAEISALEAAAKRRSATYRDEVLARLPLEMKRTRLTWIDSLLRAELEGIKDSLSPGEALDLLLNRLAEAAPAFGGKPCRVRMRGVKAAGAAERIAGIIRVEECSNEEVDGSGRIGLEAASLGGDVTFMVSLDSVFDDFEDLKRGEMAHALVGALAEAGMMDGEGER